MYWESFQKYNFFFLACLPKLCIFFQSSALFIEQCLLCCPSGAIKRKVELEWGTEDTEYLQKIHTHVEGALNEFQPDIVVYNAGTDILDGDPLGGLAISPQVCDPGELRLQGRTLPWHTHTSPFPFHPSLPSWLSLTLNISVLLVPVPVSFIFSLKYTDCQHPNSNQREMNIFHTSPDFYFPCLVCCLWFFFPLTWPILQCISFVTCLQCVSYS